VQPDGIVSGELAAWYHGKVTLVPVGMLGALTDGEVSDFTLARCEVALLTAELLASGSDVDARVSVDEPPDEFLMPRHGWFGAMLEL
jgi:hypothetical protein